MSDSPKLIGIVRVFPPRYRKLLGDVTETIESVAFDTDGQPWGAVTRYEPIGMHVDVGDLKIPVGGDDIKISRVDMVRWVRFEAMPFCHDEVVTVDGGWKHQGEE